MSIMNGAQLTIAVRAKEQGEEEWEVIRTEGGEVPALGKGERVEWHVLDLATASIGKLPLLRCDQGGRVMRWKPGELGRGDYTVLARLLDRENRLLATGTRTVRVGATTEPEHLRSRSMEGETRPSARAAETHPLPVTLMRTSSPTTPDEILWPIIRRSTDALSFGNYKRFIDLVFCSPPRREETTAKNWLETNLGARSPLGRMDIYQRLKLATEVFLIANCGINNGGKFCGGPFVDDLDFDLDEEIARLGHDSFGGDPGAKLKDYLVDVNGSPLLPYLAIIAERLGDDTVLPPSVRECFPASFVEGCRAAFERRLQVPCLIELIWSYWHEEAMQAQAINAIVQRFQNRRASGDRDPLAQLEVDPLRPLNNLMWGLVQDEMNRLSVLRRAHEYDHQYGITLHGKAVAELRSADRRSKFLESLHNLLYQCVLFYRQDDDTTVVSDGFPVLNAVKETHYLLAQGAHNQFGDLPVTARQEMLMEQYTLARPEMGEFLRGRVMVPYPEEWMDRVDTVKTLKGWTDVSVVHFHDLAVFGEQILLSIRWNNWSQISDPNRAKNWARYWRQEIQGYIHAYRAATGVDLASDITAQSQQAERNLPPSVLLRRRLAAQHQSRG